uniref:Uncharacterized protein n=1 Tax=Anguilla anguilla TaxID=7936 RepID=A0A0E9WA93_ANGAN
MPKAGYLSLTFRKKMMYQSLPLALWDRNVILHYPPHLK